MVFSLELGMEPRLGLEVSPALVVFGEMLMLPYDAMHAAIEDELLGNTALERLESECPVCAGRWRTRCPVCAPPSGVSGPGPFAVRLEAPDAEPDTHALLRAVRAEVGTAEVAVAEYLVGSLDEHGFLDRSCAQVAAELGVPEAVVARVAEVIGRVGPPGVGAGGVTECLLRQLDALDCDPDDATARLAREVVAGHLTALAKGHFAAIATALSVSRDEVRRVLEFVKARLRPYPAFDGNAAPRTGYVVPDVLVRPHGEISGEFAVTLVEPAMNRLRIRRDSGQLPQARSFLALLRDRWETLRRVVELAVERQKDFLCDGPAALRPLTRAEAAAELGLHESTVSRAVADKFVLLPDRTIVPLAKFFGVSGGVDEELRRLLAAADGPVSDQRLADLLCAAGYPIARRTVAKHRARLGFASTALR
ncbi:RNA polymerase factor sigma-54 [Amycolatopsis lexingtonensis]|uniref:RNA polymerase factor sigma-54 n=1 Tax=Amycolatopsis lexingtonensis TaxID=218822 RepID=UPI003F720810